MGQRGCLVLLCFYHCSRRSASVSAPAAAVEGALSLLLHHLFGTTLRKAGTSKTGHPCPCMSQIHGRRMAKHVGGVAARIFQRWPASCSVHHVNMVTHFRAIIWMSTYTREMPIQTTMPFAAADVTNGTITPEQTHPTVADHGIYGSGKMVRIIATCSTAHREKELSMMTLHTLSVYQASRLCIFRPLRELQHHGPLWPQIP